MTLTPYVKVGVPIENVETEIQAIFDDNGITARNLSDVKIYPNHMSNYATIVVTTTDISSLDAATYALNVIEYEHHEIHAGSHYNVCGYTTLGNEAVLNFTVVTPNTTKWTHMSFDITGTGALSVQTFEGATVDTPGSAVTAYNNDRNSSNTSGLTIRTGDTFTDDGTQIWGAYGGALKTAGFIGRDREIILKQNTTYIFRITNALAQDNVVSYCGEWYEHTNKE